MSKIISLLLCASCICAVCCFADETISVQGFARLFKPADNLSVSITVVTEDKTASGALDQNSTKMQNVLEALKSLGLGKNEIQTGSFDIRPIMSIRPDNAKSDWTPRIVSYKVSNSLNIQTGKLSMAGDIIDTATKAGANSISSLAFSLKDPRLYQSEAITAAAKNGMEDAKTLADAAGVGLGDIVSATLVDSPIAAPQFKTAMAFRDAATPIESGDVEVTATVKLVYEIESH